MFKSTPMFKSIVELDRSVLDRVHSLSYYQQSIPFFKAISASADGWIYIIFPPVYYLFNPEDRQILIIMAYGFMLERTAYFLIKNTCRRRRPPDAIPGFKGAIRPNDKFSFPSGHTSAAFLFSTIMVIHFGLFLLPLYIWSSLTGLSRVVLGVHFPADVLMGAMLGVCIGFFEMNLVSVF